MSKQVRAPRFGQGPRIKVTIDPLYGDVATTYSLTVSDLRPGEAVKLVLHGPSGTTIFVQHLLASRDGVVRPLRWQPGVYGTGEFLLKVASVDSGEQVSHPVYVRA
jgi:hypothetical protein